MKDLTVSNIERQNVLNNRFAINKIQEQLDITGMLFEGEYWLTKKMVADFYGQPILALKKHSREVEIPLYFLNSKTIIQHVLPFNMRLSNLSLPIYLGY